MTVCERLSERIPEVMQGRARWTAEEAAHLAACPDCDAEWRLISLVTGMATRAPATLDPNQLTAAVRHRVAADRRARRRSWRRWAVSTGAAAAIAAALWTAGRGSAPAVQSAPPAAEIVLPELEPLETAELDSLLDTMDSTAVWSALGEPTLADLEADELEQVLGTWEG